MALPLPDKLSLKCNEQTARTVDALLTSVIAGHPEAITTYRFYEELDLWLGPWGARGYPIGYGKAYNIAFTESVKLRSNPTTHRWVRRTTIQLQTALKDYVVGRVRNCSIGRITEAELRAHAFATHARAYTRSGLAIVVLTAPELIPVVMSIPGKEFIPWSRNFVATTLQFLVTGVRSLPEIMAVSLTMAALPAHTGNIARGFQKDQRQFFQIIQLSQRLENLRQRVVKGEFDHLPALNAVIAWLNATEFPDQRFGAVARDIVRAAQWRRGFLLLYYQQLLPRASEMRQRIEAAQPRAIH